MAFVKLAVLEVRSIYRTNGKEIYMDKNIDEGGITASCNLTLTANEDGLLRNAVRTCISGVTTVVVVRCIDIVALI